MIRKLTTFMSNQLTKAVKTWNELPSSLETEDARRNRVQKAHDSKFRDMIYNYKFSECGCPECKKRQGLSGTVWATETFPTGEVVVRREYK